MADKKRDILEFVEQSNFEQMIPTLFFVHQNKNTNSIGFLFGKDRTSF
jgi:hypothetical protein